MSIDAYESTLEFFSDPHSHPQRYIPENYDVKFLAQLKSARKRQKLVIVLGAGVSVPFNLTDWNSLLRSLFSEIFQTKTQRSINRLIKYFDSSAPSITRFLELETSLKANLRIKLKRNLYRNFKPTASSHTIDGIVRLMNPNSTTPHI